jgi:hypothetical protein
MPAPRIIRGRTAAIVPTTSTPVAPPPTTATLAVRAFGHRGGELELRLDRTLQLLRVGHRPHGDRVLGETGYRRGCRDGAGRDGEAPVGDVAHRRAPRPDGHRVAVGVDALETLVHAADGQASEDVQMPQLGELGARGPGRDQIELGERLLVRARLHQDDLEVVRGLRAVGERDRERHARVAPAGDDHAFPRGEGSATASVDYLHAGLPFGRHRRSPEVHSPRGCRVTATGGRQHIALPPRLSQGNLRA